MTAIVGVLCRDGLVIGTDSSMTFGSGMGDRTIEQPTEKLKIYSEAIIVAGTGQVGLGQRFGRVVEQAYAERIFLGSQHHTNVGTEICRRTIANFALTGAKMGQYGALVGFALAEKPYLCEFPVSDFQPEFKTDTMWYCSMGSGQPITDPFLALMREVFWKSNLPSVQDATFAVTWALDHAVQVNPGGINGPVRIAVMERHVGKLRPRVLQDADLEEHRQNIEQAKGRLRSFPASQSADAPGTPEIPRPDPQKKAAQ
jgi:20S proteasome alpha/beta subunit